MVLLMQVFLGQWIHSHGFNKTAIVSNCTLSLSLRPFFINPSPSWFLPLPTDSLSLSLVWSVTVFGEEEEEEGTHKTGLVCWVKWNQGGLASSRRIMAWPRLRMWRLDFLGTHRPITPSSPGPGWVVSELTPLVTSRLPDPVGGFLIPGSRTTSPISWRLAFSARSSLVITETSSCTEVTLRSVAKSAGKNKSRLTKRKRRTGTSPP